MDQFNLFPSRNIKTLNNLVQLKIFSIFFLKLDLSLSKDLKVVQIILINCIIISFIQPYSAVI